MFIYLYAHNVKHAHKIYFGNIESLPDTVVETEHTWKMHMTLSDSFAE